MVKLSEDLLACISNSDIHIIDIASCKIVKTLIGHSGYIFCLLKLNESLLASGSLDKTIKIWDVALGTYNNLEGHNSSITCLVKINNNYFASGSWNSIKIWSIANGNCIKTLLSIEAGFFIMVDDVNMAICNLNNSKIIRILDIQTGEFIKIISNQNKTITCLAKINENQLAIGDEDNIIKIVELNSGNCIKTLVGHTNSIKYLIKQNDNQLISGSYDKKIKVWEI